MIRRFPSSPLALSALLAVAAAAAKGEQLWLSQGASVHATDALRFTLSNTMYTEHGEHFANEIAPSFRFRFSPNWSAGGGMTFAQNRVEREVPVDGAGEDAAPIVRHHWDWSGRPSEHVALDWSAKAGGWSVLDSNRVYLYFREGERDWAVYRNIFTVTAPPLPGIPWTPRPYFTQQLYFSGRHCYAGLDRFSQFRTIVGLRARPLDHLQLSGYWQFRDIENTSRHWNQVRIVGFSANLLF